MFAIKQLTGFSLDGIGFICGNGRPYDHATVLNAYRKVKNEVELYEDRKKEVDELMASLYIVLHPEKQDPADQAIIDLLNRIKDNLKMSINEVITFNYIRSKFK